MKNNQIDTISTYSNNIKNVCTIIAFALFLVITIMINPMQIA